jgi:predicted nucleic acid-binding protein
VRYYNDAPIRVSHNYVLAEFVALAQTRRFPREESLAFAADMTADPEVEIVWIDPALHEQAMRLLQSQLDKTYSLCDALSFVLMQQRSLIDALTTDHHFAQAGFRRLLSS